MERVPVPQALAGAAALLRASGLDEDKAAAVARRLVEADLLGHGTHGLRMLPIYLERLADGRIARSGNIEVLQDHASGFSWQANRLPGAWVMERFVDAALERSATHPVVTATLANCTHIGALQAYMEHFAERKLLALMMVTDPAVASVAAPGGVQPVTTTNPIGACIPTHDAPLLVDLSTTLMSNSAAATYAAAGRKLPGDWLVDNEGRPTDDPKALTTNPPGTLMPLGGADFGYKGFAFGLLVEAFALALAGFGRDGPRQRGAQGVFLQVISPDAFGHGRDAFLSSMSHLVAQCHAGPAAPGASIRLPGERALARRRQQLEEGLQIDADIPPLLDAWARKLGLERFV
ncbi:MAG TPA: Ldh family oxidoreductase [Ramlibacter sp.]|uniref:Ldh family oxidoreductase n=1 Tax=Ramlibacter sp. TaxID=1917967 RepID=UPI002ED09A9C